MLDLIDMRCSFETPPGGFHVQMEAIIAWQPLALKSREYLNTRDK